MAVNLIYSTINSTKINYVTTDLRYHMYIEK